MRTILLVLVTLGCAAEPLASQSVKHPPDDTTKTFFVRGDLTTAAIGLAATGITSIFDKRIQRWAQSPSVQDSSRTSVMKGLTHVNETTLTAAAILTWGIGRLAHSNTTADVGLHTAEAVVLTSVISQAIRGPLGRTRPSVTPDDQYHFEFGKGFTHFDNRSFPSLHSATAFAAATALSSEIHERNPNAAWYISPLFYGAAMIPGITRVYLNQHWASDIVSGAIVGTMLGRRVVHYAHTHERNKLDRALLGVAAMPDASGRWMVTYSVYP